MKHLYSFSICCALLCTTFFAAAQVQLNSYPTSSAVVFLDFDGQTVNGTSWNSNGTVNCAAAGLNAAQMTEVFHRVAEDFRPFNLNITTDSSKYFAAPAHQRIRVILTTSYEWYGAAGGVSFLNSFTWGDNTPAFVFTSLLGYNAKNVAEAASHEAGHSLGLRHQAAYDNNCSKIADYNSGVGTGEISWAPIMGAGYSKNLTLWNNGADPSGCSSIQDDLGIITSQQNNFGFRPDDHGNSTTNATATQFNNNRFSLGGIIEKNNDVDVIRINIPLRGKLVLDAVPFNVAAGNLGSNLDLQVELLDNAGNLIRVYNPTAILSATVDTTLNEGDYFMRVRGMGNINAPNYASLGSYTLNATYTTTALLPLHKLELNGVTERGNHKFNWEIVADEKLVQQAIEVSLDGRNWDLLSSASVSARSYFYLPQAAGVIYYRLSVKFDNDKQYYSNIIALKNEKAPTAKPSLVGNMIRNSMNINSPGAFSYTVFDFNGRTISKGTLAQGMNTIAAPSASAGMYVIQYFNGTQQFTEKFVKQ